MNNSIKTYVMLAAALMLIVVGLSQEQNLIVLHKAIKICLECVGIG